MLRHEAIEFAAIQADKYAHDYGVWLDGYGIYTVDVFHIGDDKVSGFCAKVTVSGRITDIKKPQLVKANAPQ
jgi:hypothetical protein